MARREDTQATNPHGTARAQGQGERRSRDRVGDDQECGEGSMSALSRMKMIERKRAPLRAVRQAGASLDE
jgi:hypothetical protein